MRAKKELWFLMKFFLIYAVLQFAVLAAPLSGLQEWIAGIEAGLLGLEVSGSSILIGTDIFIISASCTGVVSAAVLAAVIFALKKPGMKLKLAMFAFGAVALLLLNLLRVYAVLLVAVGWGTGAAELAHAVSWLGTAFLVLLVWYFATKKIMGTGNFAEML